MNRIISTIKYREVKYLIKTRHLVEVPFSRTESVCLLVQNKLDCHTKTLKRNEGLQKPGRHWTLQRMDSTDSSYLPEVFS